MAKETYTKWDQTIVDMLRDSGGMRAKHMMEKLGISRARFFVVIKPLIDNRIIDKVGRVPDVFYVYNTADRKVEVAKIGAGIDKISISNNIQLDVSIDDIGIIEKNFYTITPDGREETGLEAFTNWCHKRHENVAKTAENYINTLAKYNKHKNSDGLIDATDKIRGSFENSHIKKMYYIDFYSIERYGKTRLGQMILYAKKSENKVLSKRIAEETTPIIMRIVREKNIDAVAFVPPTEHRKYQFMDVLSSEFDQSTPVIDLVKVKTDILVPQKTLSKIEDRVVNAKNTIFVNDKKAYKNVLIIDDAVGSGATFNEISNKLIANGNAQHVYCVGIVGSYNGFEIIKEA